MLAIPHNHERIENHPLVVCTSIFQFQWLIAALIICHQVRGIRKFCKKTVQCGNCGVEELAEGTCIRLHKMHKIHAARQHKVKYRDVGSVCFVF